MNAGTVFIDMIKDTRSFVGNGLRLFRNRIFWYILIDLYILSAVYYFAAHWKIQSPIKEWQPIIEQRYKPLKTTSLIRVEGVLAQEPTVIPTPTVPSPEQARNDVISIFQVMFGQFDISSLDNVVNHESHYNTAAVNPTSGACGIFQANPCSKLISFCGENYKYDAKCQARWGVRYMLDRYGSPEAAWNFWKANGSY